jgi:hypothetical protein
MTNWIEWNGGACPIKSDKTRVECKNRDGEKNHQSRWWFRWEHQGWSDDIIAYRIIEDHEPKEPKMTREQITAQIAALQKQLDALPVVKRVYWGCGYISHVQLNCSHYFDIETINGVPHIHGVAMKEVGK